MKLLEEKRDLKYALYQLGEIEPKALFDYRTRRAGAGLPPFPREIRHGGKVVGKVLSVFSFPDEGLAKSGSGVDAGIEIKWATNDGYRLGRTLDVAISGDAVKLVKPDEAVTKSYDADEEVYAFMATLENGDYERLTDGEPEPDPDTYELAKAFIENNLDELLPNADYMDEDDQIAPDRLSVNRAG